MCVALPMGLILKSGKWKWKHLRVLLYTVQISLLFIAYLFWNKFLNVWRSLRIILYIDASISVKLLTIFNVACWLVSWMFLRYWNHNEWTHCTKIVSIINLQIITNSISMAPLRSVSMYLPKVATYTPLSQCFIMVFCVCASSQVYFPFQFSLFLSISF